LAGRPGVAVVVAHYEHRLGIFRRELLHGIALMDWDDDDRSHGHGASDDDRIAAALERLANLFERFLFPPVPRATGFKISQLIGGIMQADITGVQKGAIGSFTGTPTPAGGLTSGVPKWSSTNPNVSLQAAVDGSRVDVQTSASDTATSFDLTESGLDDKGNAISSTVQVPLLGSVTPPPVSATGFDIKQIA
jgi:hypothetical protein